MLEPGPGCFVGLLTLSYFLLSPMRGHEIANERFKFKLIKGSRHSAGCSQDALPS
jgi:hypothetical protein